MRKAPERITASVDIEAVGKAFVKMGFVTVGTEGVPEPFEPAIYTRADITAAQVAAAYERAAKEADDYMEPHVANGIRNLATDTQTDALEQVRKEAERAGYERGARLARNMALIEAAGKCGAFDGPVSESEFVNGQSTAAQQIRAAILSLMTPDEQTEAAQELAFRKAVSS